MTTKDLQGQNKAFELILFHLYMFRDLMIEFKGYSHEYAAKQSRKLYDKMLAEQLENKHLFTGN